MLKIEKTGKSQIKSQNRVRVFREILKNERISRTQLEKLLSISAPSVTRVVEDLLREGLIYEEGRSQTCVGRHPIMLCVKKEAYYSIGINLSRSQLYLCVNNLGEETVFESSRDIREAIHETDILNVVDAAITEALSETKISEQQVIALGLASRGMVNREKGIVVRFPATGEEIAFQQKLRERFECPILVENNVAADLKWEYLNRFATNRDLVYIFVDEGVGGSIISNGEEVTGEKNMAARFGHLLVEPGGVPCTCGKRGHLEGYVTKQAIEAAYRQTAESLKPVQMEAICKRAAAGEPAAIMVLDHALDKLAAAVSQILLVLNPGMVVLYGDFFELYDGVIARLTEKVGELIYSREIMDIQWTIREKSKVRIENSVAKLAVEHALAVPHGK